MASIRVQILEVFPLHEPERAADILSAEDRELPARSPQSRDRRRRNVRRGATFPPRFMAAMRESRLTSMAKFMFMATNATKYSQLMIRIARRAAQSLRLAPALIVFIATFAAQAHRASDSYLTLRVEGSKINGQWDIALRDLGQAVSLDADGDGNITWDELKSKQKEIADYAESHLHLTVDGVAMPLEVSEPLIEQFSDGAYAVVRFALDTSETAKSLDVDYRAFFDLDAQHRGLMRLELGGKTRMAVFSPQKPAQSFGLTNVSRWREFLDFVKEGVWHIWLGFDHILFLIALLLPSVLRRSENGWEVVDGFRTAFIKVLKIVTAFTVAHSITLSLATLGMVRMPSRLVESTIAASVILAALNNIRPIFPERGWIVAFTFGLIHGFGFANVLADLGLAKQTLALALVGFNLGVELGQLAIVALFLPLAFSFRGSWVYQKLTFRFGSGLIVVLAATWMVERIWDVKVLPF